MINLEIGELYGLESERELMEAIQALLDRSKEDKNWNDR